MGARARAAALAALAALSLCGATTGCGLDHETEAVSTAPPAVTLPPVTPSVVPEGPDGFASAGPAPLPTTLRSEAKPAPLGQRAQARLEIPGGPDWLAAGAGSVWVKTDTGNVVRVDPATNKVITTVSVSPDALCKGLGASDSAVWSCGDGGTVARIDPATNTVAAVLEVGKYGDQGQIPVAFDRAWVLTDGGTKLTAIDSKDQLQSPLDLGTRCIELTASATAIWAACPIDGVALRIDPFEGRITTRIEGLTSTRAIAAANGLVWAGFVGGVARIEESTGRVTAVADADPGLESGVAASGDAVWARSNGDFLRRIDPASARVVEDLTAPERSGGEVLLAFGSVWATAYDENVLYRVAPSS